MRRLLVLAALMAALTVAGPAQAATTDVTVRSGTYDSPATAFLAGSATCNDPSGVATVTVTSLPGSPYVITGERQVPCDGLPHDYAVTVTGGPFTQGNGYAGRVTLVEATTGTRVTKVFKVVLR